MPKRTRKIIRKSKKWGGTFSRENQSTNKKQTKQRRNRHENQMGIIQISPEIWRQRMDEEKAIQEKKEKAIEEEKKREEQAKEEEKKREQQTKKEEAEKIYKDVFSKDFYHDFDILMSIDSYIKDCEESLKIINEKISEVYRIQKNMDTKTEEELKKLKKGFFGFDSKLKFALGDIISECEDYLLYDELIKNKMPKTTRKYEIYRKYKKNTDLLKVLEDKAFHKHYEAFIHGKDIKIIDKAEYFAYTITPKVRRYMVDYGEKLRNLETWGTMNSPPPQNYSFKYFPSSGQPSNF